MKKTIRYSVFLIIFLISIFGFVGKAYADVCSEHKDVNSCEAEKTTYCVWADQSVVGEKKAGCYEGKDPVASSTKCTLITDLLTCTVRNDCITYNNKCISSDDAKNLLELRYKYLIVKKTDSFKCSNVKYLTMLWTFLRIITPFIVILFGSLDFFKAMIASDEKGIKASRGKFIKRLIAFFLLIILPFTIQFIFSTMGTYGSQNMCMVKCIVTNDTSAKGCE